MEVLVVTPLVIVFEMASPCPSRELIRHGSTLRAELRARSVDFAQMISMKYRCQPMQLLTSLRFGGDKLEDQKIKGMH